jgi:hypothetical protein
MNCHVVPCLGRICLHKLSISDINEFYLKLALAPSTAALLHNVLRSCLKAAVEGKVIAANPALGAKPVKKKTIMTSPVEAEPTGLDEEETGTGIVLDES